MLVTCQVCKSKIDRDTAYKVTVKNVNKYYCSESEYLIEEKRKQKAKTDKDCVYKLICDIFCVQEIINTVLWKEWKVWNKVKSDEIIAKYLDENKSYLTGVISRLSGGEYNKIRYLSAILKNSLGDYRPKVVEQPKIVEVDMTMYNAPVKPLNKRRSLADLEDEV